MREPNYKPKSLEKLLYQLSLSDKEPDDYVCINLVQAEEKRKIIERCCREYGLTATKNKEWVTITRTRK